MPIKEGISPSIVSIDEYNVKETKVVETIINRQELTDRIRENEEAIALYTSNIAVRTSENEGLQALLDTFPEPKIVETPVVEEPVIEEPLE